MPISELTIQELRRILKEDYGKDMDTKEAAEIAASMVGYFDLLAKIYHRKKEREQTNDRRPP